MTILRTLLGLAICVALAGCAQQEPQPAPPPFKPVASVLDIMESLVGHMATDIFASVGTIIDETGTHEIVPQNDEAWDEVRFAAMGLAETGNLLMFEGRAKDQGDWLTYSQQMVDRSVDAAKAAEARDPAELLDAGGRLYEVCQACHMQYIPQ
jgi:mono/diheme cytochrome c family protein